MANQSFNIPVVVSDKGTLKIATTGVNKLGDAVKRAKNETEELHRTQNQGIIGTANSTKSFSKLAQTIGSGNTGLVGAYATLAANIFAVSAAFNALRGAAQAEQVLKGLEAAGIRSGLSLTTTAKALKEVTGNAISAEEALRATAQISAAGFGDAFVKRLGAAAKDSSFALGRNVTDTVDRLTRGIVKLEPELLDELGIFTKLTESNARYASQLNKNESQLSGYEKRVGFANAALSELELKFGNISNAAGGNATAFDKLAANFSDLTKVVFNLLNVLAKPIAGVLAESMVALAGVGVLFASTLKSQLAPGLLNSARSAGIAAEAFKKEAQVKFDSIKIAKEKAIADRIVEMGNRSSFDYIGTKGVKVYQDQKVAIKEAILAGREFNRDQQAGINSLKGGIRINTDILKKNPNYAEGTELGQKKIQELALQERELKGVRDLQKAVKQAQSENVDGIKAVTAARREAAVASALAANKQAAANTLEAASTFKFRQTLEGLGQAYASNKEGSIALGASSTSVFTSIRAGAATAGLAVRALGAAFLNAIPFLGQALLIIGLLKAAYEGLKSDATKKLEKAYSDLTETLKNANAQSAELVRMTNSQAAASSRAAATLTLQSNAAREAGEKFDEYIQAFKNAGGDISDGIEQGVRSSTVATFWEAFGEENILSYNLGIKRGTQALDIAGTLAKRVSSGVNGGSTIKLTEAQKSITSLYNSLEQTNNKSLQTALRARGGFEAFKKSLVGLSDGEVLASMQKLKNEVVNGIGSAAEAVKSFQEAQKIFNDSVGEFSRASVIKTPYDDLVRNSQTLLNTMNELKEVSSSSEFTALLSGFDERSKSVLEAGTNDKITAYLKADATIQAQINGEKKIGVNLTLEDFRAAQKTLATNQNLGNEIAKQFSARTQLFRQYQEEDRLHKSALELLKAEQSARSKIYAMGGAGRLAQIKDEERVRELQKAQLQTQINMHKLLISQTENLLVQIAASKALLNTDIQRTEETAKRIKIETESKIQQSYKDQYGKELNVADLQAGSVSSMSVEGNTRALIQSYETVNKTLADVEKKKKEFLELGKQEIALTQQVQDHLDSIKALNTQIAAINTENLTKEIKLEQIRAAQAELYAETLKLIEGVVAKTEELAGINNEIYAITNNVTNRMDYQLVVITRSAEIQRRIARDTTATAKEAYEQAKRSAIAEKSRSGLSKELRDAVDSAVQAQENNLLVLEKQRDVELQIIDANERKAILEKVNFDTRAQGLEWQKDALSAIQKQLDAERELTDQVRKTGELRTTLAAKRGGYEISKLGQSANEINTAKDALDFAIRESEIKKSLIDLEFALLAAQRDNLELELSTRKLRLEELNKEGQYNTQINQLDRILSNLPSSDTLLQAAEIQKKLVERNIENLRLNLDIASTFEKKGFGGAIASALAGLLDYRDARKGASRKDPTPYPTGGVVDGSKVKTTQQITAELAAMNDKASPLGQNTSALLELRDVIKKWILDNPTQTVNAGSVLSSNNANASALATALKAAFPALKDFQIAGFLGSTQQESQFKPGASEAGGQGRGIAQLTTEDRKAEFVKIIGRSVLQASAAEQIKFIIYELQKHSYLGIDKLLASANVEQATKAVTDNYYRPNKKYANDNARLGYARSFLKPAAFEVPKSTPTAPTRAERNASGSTVSTQRASDQADPGAPIVVNANKLNQNVDKSMEGVGGRVPDFSWTDKARAQIHAVVIGTQEFDQALRNLGPEGEAVVAIKDGIGNIGFAVTDAIDTFSAAGATFSDKFSAIGAVASAALSTISSVLTASSDAKIANIDREIAAEQRRDGKSAESVAKIASMEKRKDAIARKAFNTNKKISIAQAIIATAVGVTQALKEGPTGIPLAIAIGALGAAQIAIIAGTSYQSTSSNAKPVALPSLLTIGKRGDTVDLAKQNNNVGGELGYLRGSAGYGNNSSNYQTIGSAYGGEMPRGYGNASFVVGEKGPEVMTPMTVRPMDNSSNAIPMNPTINIHAIDARGVEEVLRDQKGNLISMLREAANSNGVPFMENVNVDVLSRPNRTAGTRL